MDAAKFIEQSGLSFEPALEGGKVVAATITREGKAMRVPLDLTSGRPFSPDGLLTVLQSSFRQLEDVERAKAGTRSEVPESAAAIATLPPEALSAFTAIRDEFKAFLGEGEFRTLLDDVAT